jgi:hemerythrin
MAELQWDPNLSVGVTEIDAQHKELFARINSLRAAMSEGKGKTEISKTTTFLEEYVVIHFGTEEKYMSKYDYPEYAAHRAKHAEFVRDFADLKRKLEQLESQQAITSFLVIDLQRRLVDWLLNHIGKVDKALGFFLSLQGH